MAIDALVSVIIPTYNRASTIKKAIDSVLNQTYSRLELIVVDDGSTDGTEEVIRSVGDARLRYVHQPNAGACAARNHGVDEAKGEIIAFHDSDDLWYPDKLEKQLKAMTETGADAVFCKLAMRSGQAVKDVFPRHLGQGFVSLRDDLFGIGTQTVVLKRAVAEQVRFDPAMPRYQDFEWLFRMLQQFRVYCLDEALVDYLIGEDSISVNQEKMYDALRLFHQKHGSMKKQCPVMFMHIVRNLGEGFVLAWKKKTGSGKFILLMLKYYPGAVRFLSAKVHRHNGA